MLVFDDSSWHEELTADWIRKTAFRLHSEQMEVMTAVGPGHIDGIVTDLLGVDRLFEHKAINHFSFERLWRGQWPLDYFTQCALYLEGLTKLNPEMTEALLLVKNKNTAQYLECLLFYHRDADILILKNVLRSDGEASEPDFLMARVTQAAVEKFAAVREYQAAQTLPPRPFAYGTDFPCGYCRWAQACWEGYEEEIAERSASIQLPDDLAQVAEEYRSLTDTETCCTKRKKELREPLYQALVRENAKAGTVGVYTVALSTQHRTFLDEEAIPPDILAKARKEKLIETLTVRAKKGGAR